MSQYFKITYVRKQVITDYLPGGATREVTREIEETIGGLPGSTVANYRRVLGDQIRRVEAEAMEPSVAHKGRRPSAGDRQAFGLGTAPEGYAPSPERGTSIHTGKVPAAAETENDPFGVSYADIVNAMVEKAA
ncbi:hypothetical protein ABID82_005081 [Methylobacterium sp. PvP062]|uniref:Uncharacterized protein n=1 Tax=Methylobacterium radiotolerans TaxID=31998 RepID=A0ABV2NU19_9HYPH|nr:MULTISPECIES: hypothetical protein [unclassified Methylobacterium]MBP2498395.1 hypothetical protein [Methylobacterium sp. PvP105]MBP2505779.1 hypothetical protein [Methylobacterium sp. PvP109]